MIKKLICYLWGHKERQYDAIELLCWPPSLKNNYDKWMGSCTRCGTDLTKRREV